MTPARNGYLASRAGLIIIAFMIAMASSLAFAANNFGQPVPGTHVYDRAGVLTPDQISSLEQQARRVQSAGAPIVVYIQAKSASYDQTESDAKSLMDAWNVQSGPEARDGLVLFLNLNPDLSGRVDELPIEWSDDDL